MKNFAHSFFNIIRDLVIGISVSILLPLISYYIAVILMPGETNDLKLSHLNEVRYQKQSALNQIESKKRGLEEHITLLVASSAKSAQEELKNVRQELFQINQSLPEKTEEFKRIDEEYKSASAINSAYKFYISSALGILFLISSAFIPVISLSFGFIIGGISSLGTGYFVYWRLLTNAIKLISLVIGVLILIGLSFKFAHKEK